MTKYIIGYIHNNSMAHEQTNFKRLKLWIPLIFLAALIITGLMLFLPAGSIYYWQAWLFMATLFIPCIFLMIYFLKHDPGLLERRIRFKEKESAEKKIIKLADLFFLIGFLIPGFDYRYGWSNIPVFIVVLSDIIIFLGYSIIFFVYKENSYTSRIIEVEKEQKVISTGPYSVIRHPMYAGLTLMFLFMPIALGSYWAIFFFVPIIALVVVRIFNEESVLSRDLKGYTEYKEKVRYRLIPGIF
jgi:protein-S-isoprenylcysteine O-methyltransferase Ste14